jgi:hypothetical protein
MYELSCTNCLIERSDGEPPARSYNPQQRYLCPDCGYAWTDSKSAGWEALLVAVAGNALVIAVALLGLALDWEFWLFVVAIVSTYGAIRLFGELRSAVEDWLDPAETSSRRV